MIPTLFLIIDYNNDATETYLCNHLDVSFVPSLSSFHATAAQKGAL